MKRGEAITMESSSIEHPAKCPQHPVWEVPTSTSQDRHQPRTIWRRIFPSWKGNACQPYPKTNSAVPDVDNASTSVIPPPPPPPPPPPSTTSGSTSCPVYSTIHHNTIRTPRMGHELPSNPDGPSILVVPSPVAPLLPPVHQSTASSSNITTTTTTTAAVAAATTTSKNTANSTTGNTTSHPSTPVVVTSNKVLPPQSPRMERPPKLPPSQHQPQRSLTVSLPPATFIASSNTGSAVIASGSQAPPPPPPPPPPLQHRPTSVTGHFSQRNLSFSSTGSRHRRSSGDWPILTSLQQISLAPPEDGFDTQSLVTMEPYHHPDATPAPPPPPPPVTLIDQPKCERRISILSDFDDDADDIDDNDRDDDHLFDLSSDEDDDDDEGNAAFTSGNQMTQKQAVTTTKTSPISFTYSSGNKSTDTCSVSPTTVILPPPPPPSSVSDAPDWMLEWAASASASGIDTPKALVAKTKYDDQLYNDTEHIEQKNDIKVLQQPSPPEEMETASCSTSSTDEISLTASDRTAPTEFVYLPMEPMPTPKKPDTNATRKVLFCAGWAVVLFDDVVTNGTPCDSMNVDSSALLLPEHYNYDESLYYIELLQGGILRCTSMVSRKDDSGTPNMIEMSICRNGASIVPVSPATAGACLALRYTTIHHWSVTNEKRGNGSCYILPVNITTRTMDRIATRRTGQKNSSGNHKSRHHYWLQPQLPVVEDESENVAGDDETSEHHKTSASLDTEYAPQAQHDAVVFLRFAFDAALQSSHV